MAQSLRKKNEKLGVIWLDAHSDMNTPQTSPSGNVHGMPLACLVGYGPKELTDLYDYAPKVDSKNVVLVGIRDVDITEREVVKRSGVTVYTMRTVMRQAILRASDGTSGIHISLDMDGVDPGEAPGVGTPVRGGFSYREAHLAMEILSDSGLVRSMEIVEVNPILDTANRTANLGVELVMSALGKRIL
jgi:arginase